MTQPEENKLDTGRRLQAIGTSNTANSTKPTKPIVKARYQSNNELQNFYDEITVKPPLKKTHIYAVSPPPVDIDKMKKIFISQDGLNPELYEGTCNFHMSHDEFYRALFSFRGVDTPDPNLLFFLTDFTVANKDILIADMKKTYILGTSS